MKNNISKVCIRNIISRYIQAWIELVVALITIATFGFYRPWWDYKFICWKAKRSMKLRTKKTKRFYREWVGQCGWGVMLKYDTVYALNEKEAAKSIPVSMYGDHRFESIAEIKEEHYSLSDDELSKLYGAK